MLSRGLIIERLKSILEIARNTAESCESEDEETYFGEIISVYEDGIENLIEDLSDED